MGTNGIDSFWDVLVWSFWIFIWISAIFIWFRCVFDLFSDHTLSGWGKAGWAILLIFVPWLGALIYLIARGRSMGERQMAAIADAQAQQEKYIKSVAAKPRPARPSRSPRQGAARLRRDHPGGVRRPQGQGPRLT